MGGLGEFVEGESADVLLLGGVFSSRSCLPLPDSEAGGEAVSELFAAPRISPRWSENFIWLLMLLVSLRPNVEPLFLDFVGFVVLSYIVWSVLRKSRGKVEALSDEINRIRFFLITGLSVPVEGLFKLCN